MRRGTGKTCAKTLLFENENDIIISIYENEEGAV